MWTYSDNWNLLPNLNIKSCLKDGVLVHYRIYPAEGYVLHVPSGDMPVFDDEGNETGEVRPYYSYGGATEFPNYDWASNPENYHADLYEEGMIVYGNNNHEAM